MNLKHSSTLTNSEVLELRNQISTLSQNQIILPNLFPTKIQPDTPSINHLTHVKFQKWHVNLRIVINKEYKINTIALIDSGADLNCIYEGLVPSK